MSDNVSSWGSLSKITKEREGRKLSGICSGLGMHTPIPTWLWRAGFVLTALISGVGVIFYIVLEIYMPKASGD